MTALTDLPVFLTLGQEQEPPTAPKTNTTTQTDGSATPPANGNKAPVGQPTGSPFGSPMFIFLIVIVAFFFIMMSGQRKEKKKKAALMAALRKGEKVQTIGGIRGTIVEVRDHEIVVKIDENNNTRMRFSRDAIQSVLSERETDDKEAEKKAE